jgi:hypothetical protein
MFFTSALWMIYGVALLVTKTYVALRQKLNLFGFVTVSGRASLRTMFWPGSVNFSAYYTGST